MLVMNQKTNVMSVLRHWLQMEEYSSILDFARNKKRTLSYLTALPYDRNQTIGKRAIKATGLAAKVITECDPEYVRNYLLRLFWLVNDESGGIGWKAPELIGEILYNCPDFEQFFPMLISLLDMEEEDRTRFHVGTVWAIGRVAQVARDAMLPAFPQIRSYTSFENEPEIKEMAFWCLKQLTIGI